MHLWLQKNCNGNFKKFINDGWMDEKQHQHDVTMMVAN
jgi:hypothetical protein